MEQRNKKTKITVGAIVVSIFLIILAVILSPNSEKTQGEELGISDNVTIQDDMQIVRVISQTGGYIPRTIYAQKDIPTVLEIESVNSYGCERAFRIPSLNIYEELPSQGITTFDLGSPNTNILGTCSMGMYTFLIKFI